MDAAIRSGREIRPWLWPEAAPAVRDASAPGGVSGDGGHLGMLAAASGCIGLALFPRTGTIKVKWLTEGERRRLGGAWEVNLDPETVMYFHRGL